MLTGRVVQFDEGRGYGFIAPDNGGEDVFVHVNILGNDRWAFGPGAPVEYEAVEGERGPKALTVRVLTDAPGGRVAAGGGAPVGPNGTATMVPARAPVADPDRAASVADADAEDGLCDVLTVRALHHEITETLLNATPDLSGGQVVAVRREMLALARRHGWTEDD